MYLVPFKSNRFIVVCVLNYKVCLKSSVNGVISERQFGACVRACAWFFRDVGKIDTQHGLHVTGSVNRLRPAERSQYER